MFSEIIKSTTAIVTISIAVSSCNSNQKAAQKLYDEAKDAIEASNYSQAIELLDSLESAYPSEVDIRRSGMHLRPQAIEGLTMHELQSVDSLCAMQQIEGDSLRNVLEYVNNPIEGYYVGKTIVGKIPASAPGLYARMSPDGHFYLISSSKKKVNSTAVAISNDRGEARSATVNYDGERNDRSMGAEVITFIQSECDTIGKFASDNEGTPLKLTFYGDKSYSIDLPKDQAKAIADVYRASQAVTRFKVTQLNKARLEKQLEVARRQIARTFPDSVSMKKE